MQPSHLQLFSRKPVATWLTPVCEYICQHRGHVMEGEIKIERRKKIKKKNEKKNHKIKLD
jgi:hypothetical protein